MNTKTQKKLYFALGALILSLGLLFIVGAGSAVYAQNSTNNGAILQPADAKGVIYGMNEPVTIQKVLTVGTKKNKGILNVGGYLRNPVKNKPLVVKDNMKVTGNLTVSGKLLGSGIIGAQNLGSGVVTADKLGSAAVTTGKIYDGAVTVAKLATDSVTGEKIQNGAITADDLAADSVTSAKIAAGTIAGSDIASSAITTSNIDMTGNGFVKAGVYVSSMGVDSTPSQQFNNLSGGSTITSTYNGTAGQYTLNFGTNIESRYFQVISRSGSGARVYPIIDNAATSGNNLTIFFYDQDGTTANPSTGFYVLVY